MGCSIETLAELMSRGHVLLNSPSLRDIESGGMSTERTVALS